MNEPATEKKSKPESPPVLSEDVRYKYIGFDVGAGKIKEFWKSPKERDEYVAKISSHETGEVRGQSFVNEATLKEADRWVLVVFGVLSLVGCVLPWIHYRYPGGEVSGGYFKALTSLLGGLGVAFDGGIWIGLGAIFALIAMVLTPLLGIWMIVTIVRRLTDEDKYIAAVRRVTRLYYIPLAATVLTVAFAMFGGHVEPIDSLGIYGASEHFGIATLFVLISYGAALPLAVSFMAAMKSNDL